MKEESDKEGISKLAHTLNLDRVVFIGRTFYEYMRMFNLEPSQLLELKVLDCPSGASSFVAEAYNEYNIKKVIGCDILYDDGQKDALTAIITLEKRGKNDLDHMMRGYQEYLICIIGTFMQILTNYGDLEPPL